MSKKMLINASHPEENRVAIVVDGILSELDIEIAGQLQTKGNIYKAVVVRVEPGLQAAFVDYGAEKHGFLQTGEIHPDLHPARKSDSKEYPRISEILHRGQEILVQVVKGERGTKGAALTTFLSLPGRYMVLMPDSSTKGVSRKIEDEKERKTLKKTMAQLNLPDEMGYIVRTAGIGKEEVELKRDFNYLVSLYKGILARKEKAKAPAQLYQESDIVIRSIRDYFSTDMDEVMIDDSQVYQQARDFFSLVMPDQLNLVKQHREKRPLFSRYQIEEQIESLARNQVSLPSGGSIVIDQTEALVAIDVNSGRMGGEKGIEATAARSNIEAAAEIGRQLRLRDLGGLIVIDFIDMRDRKKVREVEQTLKESVKDDKARITLGKISQFGLLELSRQRIRPTLSVGAYLDCPHCHGKGRVKSPEAQAVALLRQLHAAVSKGQIGTIKATIPLDVANYLHNERRQALTDLEKRFDLKIQILASLDAIPEQVELELLKREKAQFDDDEQAPVSHSEGIEKALAAANTPEKEEPSAPPEIAADVTVAEATPEIETAGESPTGKRRRRRRRKRRSGGADPAPADQQTEETTTRPDQDETTTPVIISEAAPVPVDESRPKRRGRKPAARKVEDDLKVVATETAAPIEQEATVAPVIVTPPLEEKPKRRRRSGAKNEPAAIPAEAPVSPETVTSTPLTETAAAAVAPPAKGRTRRPAAKKRAAAAPVVSVDAETPTPEKPKRTGRRPAAKKSDGVSTVIPDKTPLPAEEKPKPRRRKTAPKKAEETVSSAAQEGASLVEVKPRRRTAKPVVKKVIE
ncbi:Rne/Rng family ribonuclease [Geopsychrobacter electrodiphilus]|uniref:Rne/Rng family ribonuclease n=1 Tax=Geopsychrobacter electrodiphilus TaxID=225196 RepID=UPI00037869C0|nr:Rne/Rng family ribonuclease [Geopsychrobacter electrodiphilus]